ELEQQKDFIDKMVRLEEERFGNTFTVGLKKLHEVLNTKGTYTVIDKHTLGDNLDYEALGKLYDTYGVPIDLIYVAVKEDFQNKTGWDSFMSSDDFTERIQNYVRIAQANSEIGKTKQAEKINPIYAALQRRSDIRTEFVGYDSTSVDDAKVVALVKDNEQVNELQKGDEGLIVLDKTPFYAESGGQVGDTGTLNDGKIKVFDTFAPVKEYVLHKSKIESGTIKVGDVVSANVDVEKRDATRRNHTATHLVHSALREVLGTHVKQAGSVVAPNYLRFDFTHYQPLSPSEIKEIEDLVNYQILQNNKVNTDLMSIEDAMRTGAMALFGEKYGEKVRVLSVGNGEFSRELCGGTHVHATGDIGSFKITADEAIASGVRRIRAITGFDSFNRFRDAEELIANSLNVLKTQRDNLPNAIEKLQEELKKTRKEVDDLKMKIATGAISGDSGQDEAKDVAGVKVIAKTVEGLDKGGMRHLSDSLMAKIKSGVVIIAKTEDEKVSFIVRVSDDLTSKVSAGNIVREIAPIVNGRGGGKPDMAEGGGTDASKLNEAIEASYKVIEKMLG
ncbi:MAG: alanine--tRNA ligase-related protein, partial [Pyrinomonadaceae bacterium]|nr:alanine--tRNA ligase-related protein [Pyrinomonadaceae bacterium]